MTFGLEISGNNLNNMPKRAPGPKMAVGERLSMCGQFIITTSGEWRSLPSAQQVPTQCAFDAAVPDNVVQAKR